MYHYVDLNGKYSKTECSPFPTKNNSFAFACSPMGSKFPKIMKGTLAKYLNGANTLGTNYVPVEGNMMVLS